jgi:hypothetical protein
LEEGGTKDETRRLRFILDTTGKPEWVGGKVPAEWSELVRKHNEKVASDDNDGALQWIDERIPPGRDVRCIVSVSMLAEGWDANTVTHIVGLPAHTWPAYSGATVVLLTSSRSLAGRRSANWRPSESSPGPIRIG